jgi:pyruvate kinase
MLRHMSTTGDDRAYLPRRRTRLVATIGPATGGRIEELVTAGLDVARINLSHGSHAEHLTYARAVRDASATVGREVGLLVDLPGPKVRLGRLPGDALELDAGKTVHFVLARDGDAPGPDGPPAAAGEVAAAEAGTNAPAPKAAAPVRTLPVTDPFVLQNLRAGDRILLADGAAELRVVADAPDSVRCEVVRGGLIRSRAGVNVPAERLPDRSADAFDDAELEHLRTLGPDFVGQSFVRSGADVEALRERLPAGVRLVAKIETRPGVDAIEEILRTADAIMVARGDLGVELPYHEVPLVQKDIIRAALAAGRPTIVATQMLESMVESPRPTRAEASDIANAVLDGADAVMLSAESAIGSWPVEALRAMARICETTDIRMPGSCSPSAVPLSVEPDPNARALAAAAVAMSEADEEVVALACFTRSGRTARLLAAFRPSVPILALAPTVEVSRGLALGRGICHAVLDAPDDPAAVSAAVRAALRGGVTGWTWPAGGAVVLVAAGSRASGPDRVEILKG